MATVTKRKKVGGRPRFQPDARDKLAVKTLAAYGLSQDMVRRVVVDTKGNPISEKTLRARFRNELDNGKAEMCLKIGSILLARAEKDASGSVAIFLARTVMGLKEVTVHELSGKDGGPIRHITRTIIDPKESDWDDEPGAE